MNGRDRTFTSHGYSASAIGTPHAVAATYTHPPSSNKRCSNQAFEGETFLRNNGFDSEGLSIQ